MRFVRLAVLVASTLFAAVLAVPSAWALTPVTFTGPTDFGVGDSPNSVAVGDFNGDGDPDLAVANEFGGSVSVLLGGAGGSFGAATNVATGGFPFAVAVGDFNGDGDPDLAVADAFDGIISVLLGSTGSTFTGPTDFPAGSFPAAVAVGEFNGDGDPDLAVADQLTGAILVLRGTAGGGFTAPTTVGTATGPFSIAVGEFNGDGDPDLAVAEVPLFGPNPGRVLVLLGSAGATFAAPATVASGLDLVSVAVGDFNGDGDPDLAVADQSPGKIMVLLGSTGGSFTGPTILTTDSGVSAVAVADFNRDGDPDLAVSNVNQSRVSVLLGDTGGTFTAATNFAAGGTQTSVVAADFNGDGKPDLAATKFTANKVAVLLNSTVTNRAPIATNEAYSTAEDTTLTVAAPGVLGNDSDPDGNPLSAVLVSGPSHGTLTLNGNGSFSYTPAADFAGSDSFTYRASDGTLESNPATVAISVTAVNDAPTAADDADSIGEDTALTVAAPGVLGNDADPDGNPLTAVLVSGPSHGTLTLTGNGSFSYTPAADFAGSDSFTYRASDGTLTSNVATVTITVTGANDAPAAAGDAYNTAEDIALNVAAPGVLGNDSDPDGNPLTAVLESVPSHGSLTLNADGSFTYAPAADFAGSDSFTYRASDGTLTSNPATVTITITATNDGPTAAGDAYSTPEDTALTVPAPGMLGNDADPDGDPLTAALVSGPSHGTLTLNANGSFSYAPAADYHGSDSFTYRASDGTLTSNPATVTITVTAANDPPTVTVAAGGTCGTDDRSGTINLTLGDVDSAAMSLALSAASSNPSLVPTGNVVFAGSGAARTMTVSTVSGRTGTAVVTVTVSDGQATGTFQLTVRAGGKDGDTMTGDDGVDLIMGQGGNDTLNGVDGNDLLCGGDGKDTLSGGVGDDTVVGGSEDDVLNGDDGIDLLNGGAGKDTLSGGVGDDTLIGASEDDVLNGDDGIDRLDGGAGKDTLSGGAGDDTLIGAREDDVLNGDDGNDLLDGGDGKDTLSGGAGDDTLIGAGHDDRLTGGPGADRFSGGPGNDKATDYTVAEGDTTDGTIP
jgi:VCBS repeat-containing protein